MKLLVLGGTGDAKQIAKRLMAIVNLEVIYSIAGLVRLPNLTCTVISGGFTQHGGLSHYLKAHQIDAILDATHPFALRMSEQAVQSAAELNIPYYSLLRESWQAQDNDQWLLADTEESLFNQLALAINQGCKNIFYTNGQISRQLAIELDAMAELNEVFGPARYIIRSAKETELPLYSHWIQAIGPYDLNNELSLFKEFEIDLLVTKNSGGDATRSKLDAARKLNIPVLMLQRPETHNRIEIGINKSFKSNDEFFGFLYELLSNDFND